ncbi:MAG: hypothetical protein PHC68_05445 [Syntrophorhabdaceae bacterium]|nr:hypothetical protein [Syntrophorhabdaceae bacterium]
MSEDSLLKDIHTRKTLHGGGTRYARADKELIRPLKIMSATAEVRLEDVKNYRIEEFAVVINKIATEFIIEVHKMMFESVGKITEFTGNVVNAAGKPFSVDMFLDMMEKIEITFNDAGEAIMPSIVAGPELVEKIKKTKFSKEQRDRQKKIMEAKKKTFYAKKCYRRLSYLD